MEHGVEGGLQARQVPLQAVRQRSPGQLGVKNSLCTCMQNSPIVESSVRNLDIQSYNYVAAARLGRLYLNT